MKTFSPIQQALIKQLQDGHCHSGNDLGQALKVSRTAVWKQIKQLIDLGLPLQSIDKQGYQFTQPFFLLDEDRLSQPLKEKGFPHAVQWHLFSSLDSTNRYLKELPPGPKAMKPSSPTSRGLSAGSSDVARIMDPADKPREVDEDILPKSMPVPPGQTLDVCCAETQTQGRGRFGRTWFSPLGENIYCSSRWKVNCDLSRLSGLSLIVSLAIVKTLKQFQLDHSVKIKWPNDLIWNHKKLCGSLIEIVAESNANAMVIIGIGLNVNSDTLKHPLPDASWCSLYEMTNRYHDRNPIIAQLMIHLADYFARFIELGFEAFKDEWKHYDYLENQPITVKQPTGLLKGIAKGVNDQGELILLDESGVYHHLSIGETSLNQRSLNDQI